MAKVTRRTMLKLAGSTSLGLGAGGRILAFFPDGSLIRQDHFVPAVKKLSPAWRKSLFDRGTKEVWSATELDAIGMPIGGIAAGQLYLCGDGTLGCWEIFNHHEFLSYGATNYAKRDIKKPVEFGFMLQVGSASFQLSKADFTKIHFNGQYPVATVTYEREHCPVVIQLSAYSPFIPLNEKDSALPCTIFEFEVENTSDQEQTVQLIGHLQNAVASSSAKQPGGRQRHISRQPLANATALVMSADPAKDEFAEDVVNPRPCIALAQFEGGTYGAWQSTGEAFGPGPASGTLPDQNPVTGFVGQGLVNTFFKGDDTKGTLTSPEFTIQRRFINFKIGGGNHAGKTCVDLLVDGRTVRTAAGLNSEHLLWDAWLVEEFEGQKATIVIRDEMTGPWGHINVDEIEQGDTVRSREDLMVRRGNVNADHGTMALTVLGNVLEPTKNSRPLGPETWVETLPSQTLKIAPKQKQTVTFALTWHFPNHTRGRQYANWFKDASDVASYVAANHERLSRDTKLWRDTYYDSTFPYWLLDRLHSTVGNLATGTTEWWGNGRFWAWEGVVCCSGTCTHVWNYEHALARLFPSIQRNIREQQDYGAAFDEATGLVGFRGNREYATDGQCGTVLKAYREHLNSADDQFLKRNWPRVKKSLEFLISHDANADGMLEDGQPNTYDIDFFGANTFVGALYLAALRAGEVMAKEMSDPDFAKACKSLFQKGKAATEAKLWNGEYFIQDVDQSVHKVFQYGPGCLSDQLFGQGWAHQVGLGHLYDPAKVKKSLVSVWTYNWAPDVAAQNKRWAPERPFAVPGEGGLFICTWPKGGRQQDPVRYRDEVWTGIEYQVAGHMVWEGMVEEGLALCRAIHDRYHPAKRNPYNEVECSDHYARALASWGVFTALSGFDYHGPKGELTFAPKMPGKTFKSAFTTAEGWGTYDQSTSKVRLKLAYGKLKLTRLTIPWSSEKASPKLDGRDVPFTARRSGKTLTLHFQSPVTIEAGQSLTVS